MTSISKQINYRKDGTIKSIHEDVNGQPYKDYKFYRDGKLKSEFNYRMNLKTNFNKGNTISVNAFI